VEAKHGEEQSNFDGKAYQTLEFEKKQERQIKFGQLVGVTEGRSVVLEEEHGDDDRHFELEGHQGIVVFLVVPHLQVVVVVVIGFAAEQVVEPIEAQVVLDLMARAVSFDELEGLQMVKLTSVGQQTCGHHQQKNQ